MRVEVYTAHLFMMQRCGTVSHQDMYVCVYWPQFIWHNGQVVMMEICCDYCDSIAYFPDVYMATVFTTILSCEPTHRHPGAAMRHRPPVHWPFPET